VSAADCYRLRAELRPFAPSVRVQMCGLRPSTPLVGVKVADYPTGGRRAWWTGVALCKRQYACPVCASATAARRRDELTRMMRGDGAGRWQMVTLTMRHSRGDSLLSLRKRLMAAWRKVRVTRVVREIFDEKVSASARALEVTYGDNGWHPHLHILLRTEEWTVSEERCLSELWVRTVGATAERGVLWSKRASCASTVEAYLSKLGAEVAGIAKEPKHGNVTPWQLAKAATTDEAARALWREYAEAMRGARILELDERAKAFARLIEQEQPSQVWRADIFAEEFAALRELERKDPLALWLVLESAIAGGLDPPKQVRIALDDALDAEKSRLLKAV
jgi:replication protein